ncbi:low temperature requirement protein A [Leifsonia sp. A12D58]|uniref:low temperature requirement protein A n=1 Tax=Leifsonia sp. A12D58 TaxID=3397674 RepID=UPI0039E0EBCF
MKIGIGSDVLRPTTGNDAHRVTFVELFFDLVFVFAVTQVSHVLLHRQDAVELGHTAMLMIVVWVVWINTTWATNWLNPERGPVRGLLIVLMLLGILMSSAIPEAFSDKAVLFAFSMVAFQLVRSTFTALAFARYRPDHAVNFVRIGLWEVVSGSLWIGGAFAPEDLRIWIWLVALLLDISGPRARFWTPGLGRSGVETWDVSGEHMAERVSLFLIIVLGESIIVTGTTFAESPLEWQFVLAFLAAFTGTVLMWMLYFAHGQQRGSDYISHASERGMIAQVAYTYVPITMVFGIVLSAVADGLILGNPLEDSGSWTAWLTCGSSALFLLGNALFRRAIGGRMLGGNVLGALVLVGLAFGHPMLSALALVWLVNVVLLIVLIGDEIVWRRSVA